MFLPATLHKVRGSPFGDRSLAGLIQLLENLKGLDGRCGSSGALEREHGEQRFGILAKLAVAVDELLRRINLARMTQLFGLFYRADESLPGKNHLNGLVGILGLFFSSNQRFADTSIQADLLIDGFAALLDLLLLLALSLFGVLSHEPIMHIQGGIGQLFCSEQQKGDQGRITSVIMKADEALSCGMCPFSCHLL